MSSLWMGRKLQAHFDGQILEQAGVELLLRWIRVLARRGIDQGRRGASRLPSAERGRPRRESHRAVSFVVAPVRPFSPTREWRRSDLATSFSRRLNLPD
jgi:hypothetical protein